MPKSYRENNKNIIDIVHYKIKNPRRIHTPRKPLFAIIINFSPICHIRQFVSIESAANDSPCDITSNPT